MEMFTDFVSYVNGIVWGPIMLVLLLGTGFYLTLGLKFFSITWIPTAFDFAWKGRKVREGEKGEVSSFNAFMTALAATVGTGNIAGVATAIFLGGPGALFWMWMTALVGMATKYAETVLAIEYREVTDKGSYVGGPMYFIRNGLGKNWNWLAVLFSLFTILASFGIGNMVQGNAVASALNTAWGIPTWASAVVLFAFCGIVILGGVKRIGEVAGKLVPSMALFYSLMAIIILVYNFAEIPAAFMLVVQEAFTPTAATGGFAGATVLMAIRFGVARGLFSNEAGLGSACIAYAAAATSNPVRMGLIGMLGTFIDTIIVCTMTGFVIIITGAWTSGLNGTELTSAAFSSVFPFGDSIIAISVALFASTTILGWCIYSERCVIFLFGEKFLFAFRVFFCCLTPIGCVMALDLAWLLADTFNALMAIPNLIGLVLLSPVVFRLTKEYVAANKGKKID